MTPDTATVLLVSDQAADAALIRRSLADPAGSKWRLEQVGRLSDGISRLRKSGIAAVLLDPFLPDSRGIGTFAALFEEAPLVPIVVLTDRENDAVGREATRRGAQEHLLKERLDGYWLPRLLRGLVECEAGKAAFSGEKALTQVMLNAIGDAVLSTDVAGNITYLNVVAERMTGWTLEEAKGRPLAEVFCVVDGAKRVRVRDPIVRAEKDNRTEGLAAGRILMHRSGSASPIENSTAPVHDRRGRVTGSVIVFHDARSSPAVMRKMAHLAEHDFLTDLPNRMLLGDRIDSAIALARRHGKQRAVLFLDLDGFKQVNDLAGHAAGDKLLQSIAQRLVCCVRSSDTVSRQGGDEFVVLLSEIERAEDAAVSADKMLAALAAPHRIAGRDFRITASIGISIYPRDGQDAETLIRRADTAMYRAKKEGRSDFRFFSTNANSDARGRPLLESIAAAKPMPQAAADAQPRAAAASS